MARIEYNAPTFTVNLPYYENGVQSLVTPNVGVSLDPVDTPLYVSFNAETLFVFFPQVFSMTFGFYQTTSTNEFDNNITPFITVDGDTIEIDGNIFTARNVLQNANDFYTITNPADLLEQRLAIQSLFNSINFNTDLNIRYNIEIIDITVGGIYTNSINANDPILAIKFTAKDNGPSYNLNIYDAILNPVGKFNANFTNYNILNDNSNYAEYNTGLNTQVIGNVNSPIFYIYSYPVNRGELLEGNDYGMYLEVWVNTNDYASCRWGRVPTLNSNFKKVVTLTQNWNISNNFVFEISNYIRPFLKIPFPKYNISYIDITLYHSPTVPNVIPENYPIAPYYCKYGEFFNGGFNKPQYLLSSGSDFLPEQIGTEGINIEDTNIRYYEIDKTELRWACRGAFPENIIPASNIRYWMAKTSPNGTDILTNQNFTVLNLTNQPKVKIRRRLNAPEYVWFYLHNDEYVSIQRNYRIRYTYFMSDNLTVVTNIITLTNVPITRSGLYVVDLNLYNTQQPNVDLIFVENNTSLRCVRILASLEWSEDNSIWFDYTDDFYYDIDFNTEYDNILGQTYVNVNTTYTKLYWRNPHGVFDQFEFEFRDSYELNTKESTFNSIAKFDYNPNYGREKAVINKLEVESELFYVIHSGWVNKEHYLWLKELIESNEVYCANGFYIDGSDVFGYSINDTIRPEAILVTKYEWELNEAEDLFNLKITYKPAFYSNNIKI